MVYSKNSKDNIHEESLMKSILRQRHNIGCDILVAGGGIAAIAAVRSGAKVILCQDRPVLGGNASSEIRMHICGADMSGGRGEQLAVEAREGGIIEEIRLENAIKNPQRSWSIMDLILYDKCVSEKNSSLMLNTTVVGADVEGNIIRKVYAIRESTEDEFVITAKVFIDCTGDGRLGAEAGAEYITGRESRDVFDEEYAQDKRDGKTLGCSLLFEAKDMEKAVPFYPPKWIRRFNEDELSFREHATLNYGYWWIEWGGCLDTIKKGAEIRHELLRILLGVWDHIKNGGEHDAENHALNWFGFVPGKRESRRFKGLYTFTEKDAMQAPHFKDTIAYGGWSLDTHPPEGIDAKNIKPCHQPPPPYLYGIPLRCCLSSNIKNLMFSGRNISASHIGFSTLRVMATCGVVGQGVGTAAAKAVQRGCLPEQLLNNQKIVCQIQDELIRNDCFLPGIKINTPCLTSMSTATASSEQPDGGAVNVQKSLTRSTYGSMGTHPRYDVGILNRWMSSLKKGLPAWIELSWPTPVVLKEIRLIFDTGLHRPLTLIRDRSCQAYNNDMIWGSQPETIKKYDIQVNKTDGWASIISVSNNYQRLAIHRFSGISTNSLRIIVTETHGINHARICRIQCFGY